MKEQKVRYENATDRKLARNMTEEVEVNDWLPTIKWDMVTPAVDIKERGHESADTSYHFYD